jgi:iron-sulfur cluster assembly accessory protein
MITITPIALKYLQENLATSPAGTVGIRIGLQDYGCSGLGYTIDFTNEQRTDEAEFEFENVKLLIANEHMKFLKGTEIDLVQEGVNTMLDFNNPNVEHECGCGESFKFKDA